MAGTRHPGRFEYAVSQDQPLLFLIERREAILRKYLVGINPIVDPTLDRSGALAFSNAAVDARVADAPSGGYKVTWFRFDNATAQSTPIGETAASEPCVQAPLGLPSEPGAYVKVEISAVGGAHPSWAKPVHVYFVRSPHVVSGFSRTVPVREDSWKLVGLERMPEGNPPFYRASITERAAR